MTNNCSYTCANTFKSFMYKALNDKVSKMDIPTSSSSFPAINSIKQKLSFDGLPFTNSTFSGESGVTSNFAHDPGFNNDADVSLAVGCAHADGTFLVQMQMEYQQHQHQ